MHTKMTLWIASVLTLFGLVMFVVTGATSPTALIPSFVGLLLLVADRLARQKRLHKHAVVGGALVSLLGFLSASVSLLTYTTEIVGPVATVSKVIMGALCGIALVLYVQAYLHMRQTTVQHA